MKIEVTLFGILADKANTRNINIEGTQNLNELKSRMEKQYPFLQTMTYFIAVNQQIVKENINLNEGDEIAFMPPFAGG